MGCVRLAAVSLSPSTSRSTLLAGKMDPLHILFVGIGSWICLPTYSALGWVAVCKATLDSSDGASARATTPTTMHRRLKPLRSHRCRAVMPMQSLVGSDEVNKGSVSSPLPL